MIAVRVQTVAEKSIPGLFTLRNFIDRFYCRARTTRIVKPDEASASVKYVVVGHMGFQTEPASTLYMFRENASHSR